MNIKKFNPLYYRKNNLIAFRLLSLILLFSSFITLAATGLQLYLDFNKDVNIINGQLKQIGMSYVGPISNSLWNIDNKQLSFLLEGIISLHGIVYVGVKSEGEMVLKKGVLSLRRVLIREYPLYHGQGDEKEKIGALTVVASLQGIYERLNQRLFVIIGSQFVKTFAVSAFILFIIHLLLTRHLSKMAEFAKGIDFHLLDKKLVLNRKKSESADELEQVVKAINAMIDNLKISADKMQKKARVEGELNAAAIIQNSFTPEPVEGLKKYQVSSVIIPAREMSGDFYDYINISFNTIAFVVGDVSGKGVSASMYANIARVLLRDKSMYIKEPVKLLSSLNQSLKREFLKTNFLTMNFYILDYESDEVKYLNAGHEPLVLSNSLNDGVQLLKPHGYPFSQLHADLFYERLESGSYHMEKGDVLVSYTDGLTDVENENGEMFGEVRLYDLIHSLSTYSAMEIQKMIVATLKNFMGNAVQNDDITMIVLKKL